jgi:methionyl-tRNA synthetase
MPRYFFNVHKAQPAIDEMGDELPNDDAAWKEATKIAGELLRSLDGTFLPGQQWGVEVADMQQQTLFWIWISAQKVK